MLQSEFTERTGYVPTYDEYRAIEELYLAFKGDKDAFCEDFNKHQKSYFKQIREIMCESLIEERDRLKDEKSKAESQLREFTRLKEYDFKLMQDKWSKEKICLESSMKQLQEKYSQVVRENEDLHCELQEKHEKLLEALHKVEVLSEAIEIVKE